MKRALMLIIIVMMVFISACQKQLQQPGQQEPETQAAEGSAQPAPTGDTATDSFGSEMGNADKDDNELSSSELDGMDSGFSDVESI